MATPDWALDIGAWMLENGHRAALKLTGGRWPTSVQGMKPVELHVIGRTTGERRSTMLTAPVLEDDRIVLVASKGGSSDHPQWYKNLAANPDVELTVDDRTIPMRAHTATGDERAELWSRVTAVYKGYADYQRNTSREIPVVVCVPRDTA